MMDLEKFDETGLETNYSSRFNTFNQCYHFKHLANTRKPKFFWYFKGYKRAKLSRIMNYASTSKLNPQTTN